MNKILKSAIVFGASYLIAGEIIYEFALNKHIINHKKNIYRQIEPELLPFYDKKADSYASGDSWFCANNPEKRVTVLPSGEAIYSNIITRPEKSHKWTIVAHGYTSCPRAMANYGYGFYKSGCNVLFPFMRGHNKSDDLYCTMGYRDKELIIGWINYITESDPEAELIVFGAAMGSATFMVPTGDDLHGTVKCCVADCGYTSCWEEYKTQMNQMLHIPAFPFLYAANTVSKLRGNFDFKKCSPEKAVAKSKIPTLFIHGEEDTFVPFGMMDKVYSACSAEKDKLAVPGAMHNESEEMHPEMYWNKVNSFISKYVK